MSLLRRLSSRARQEPIALLCLIAMSASGTAFAAVHLGKGAVKSRNIASNAVTSSKVKNGSLLKSDFKAGQIPAGAQGIQGPIGPQGTPGTAGGAGTNGSDLTSHTPLPSGQTEAGVYVAMGGDSTAGHMSSVMQFTQPLAAALDGAHTAYTATTTSHCPGPGQADPGYLCAYERRLTAGASFFGIQDPSIPATFGASKYGAFIAFTLTGADAVAYGTWAVTAP